MASRRTSARAAATRNARRAAMVAQTNGAVTENGVGSSELAAQGVTAQFSDPLLLPNDIEIYAQWEFITPELAKQYLVYNTHNRNLRDLKVEAYAADMINGDWRQTGDPIQFGVDDDGDVVQLNGAHRLNAIIRSGLPQWLLVVHGLSLESQATMDAGIPRRFADHLKNEGEINVLQLATAVRSIFLWELGDHTFTGNYATSIPQLTDCLARHPWLRDEITYLSRINRFARIPIASNAALYYVFNEINAEDAQHFWERLMSEEDHHAGDPIFILRKTLLNNAKEIRGRRNIKHLTALTIKAWNKYRNGEQIQQLMFKPGGAHPEKFPVIDGYVEPDAGDIDE